MRRDTAAYISENLPVRVVPHLPHIKLHMAAPESGVWWLACDGGAPYWAWCWPGGLALAQHLAAEPALVTGRTVLDLGTGSGLAAIAAALAGAGRVIACDIDPTALVAAVLNAGLNGVDIETLNADLLAGPPPEVETVLVGDLFYDPALANAVLPFLMRCRDAGIDILIGDIGRSDLPGEVLVELAAYRVVEFGEGQGERMAGVYRLKG